MKCSQTTKIYNSNYKLTFTALTLLFLLMISIPSATASGESMTEPEWDSNNEQYLVSNLTELNWIRNAPKEDYKLVDDINATPTKNWNNGKGWKPIGEENYAFLGSLKGQGNEVKNLTINRPDKNKVGLIGLSGPDSEIKGIGISGEVEGGRRVGMLIGESEGTINNSFSRGNLTGNNYYVGGLVGLSEGQILNSYSSTNVTGNVDYGEEVGGLVGHADNHIRNSFTNGSVDGKKHVGGLVGNLDSHVSNSYSTSSVTGNEMVGGLVGKVDYGKVFNSYTMGNVSGDKAVGGIVGYLGEDRLITQSYSASYVSKAEYSGGIVGWNVGTVESSFWNTQKSGLTESDGGVGKNTSEMKNFWTFRDSLDLEDEHYESGEPVDVTLKKDNDRDIALNTEDNSFKLVKVNESHEHGDEAVIEVNGNNKTVTESSSITVSGTDIGLRHVSDYQDPSEADLEFYVDNLWDLKNISSFKNVNQSYEWNIVDGESYPFLTWEEKEEGNQSVTIEVEDDLGNSIENASVRMDAEDKETDSSGEASFEDLYEAEYTAIANKKGYRENSSNFDLTQDGQTEKVVIEKIKSDFNITDITLNTSRVDKGEEFSINVTVKNNGSETGRRNLDVVVDGETKEREVQLDSGESEILEFTASEDSEGESIIYASIFDVTRNETISVGPKEFNLEIESSEGGSTNPSSGNYTYEEGKSLTVKASSNLGWEFDNWTGDVSKDSKEITLTMDEGKEIKPNYNGVVEVSFDSHGSSPDKHIEGENLSFGYKIVNNKDSSVKDNITAQLKQRNISVVKQEIEINSGDNYSTKVNGSEQEFKLISGDASEDAKLELEYADRTASKDYHIAAIKRDLKKGYNYFSVPEVTDEGEKISDIFDGGKLESVWTYNNGQWKNYHSEAPSNPFDTFSGGQGYIVEVTEDITVYPKIDTNLSRVDPDTPIGPASHNISSGWNLVGSYWQNPKASNHSEAFSSMPDDHITQTLYSQKDGGLGLKELNKGKIKSGRAYWVSAKSQASYTKSD
ncbi:hypothetical protein GLU26_02140 [Nanohaloarchaea archaeon]|nr:hypothetical protein [Candidatus Nanohaloarchaea archaeon]